MTIKTQVKSISKKALLAAFLLAAPLLGGCTSQEGGIFGDEKRAPDEFAVYSRAPLSLPPDYGLRPPKPGASRPQTLQPRNDARDALLSSGGGQTAAPAEAGVTPGITALLNSAGANQADPNIRSLVNSETATLSGLEDEGFADRILFWRQSAGQRGAVIDPAAEERRLRRREAAGDAVEELPQPTIRRGGKGQSRGRDDKGFWSGWFD